MESPGGKVVRSNKPVLLQHGPVAINFTIETFDHGLIPALSMFGYKLWYGYMHRDVFLNQLIRKTNYATDELVVKAILAKQDPEFINLIPEKKESIQTTLDCYLKHTRFARYLTNLALTENWKMPALINRNASGKVHQQTGATRAFATKMTRTFPWKHFPVLVLDHDRNDINDFLENPMHCQNDQILNEVFGKTITAGTQDPEVVIEINVSHNKHTIDCNLIHIHDGGYVDPYQGRGQDLLDSHVNWRKKVGFCPKLYIYTNNPTNIKDNDKCWNVQFVPMEVDQGFINECAKRPAWFEKVVREYRDNPIHEPDSFVLWVLDDRVINIADLAWWGDDQTNVMIDADWKFILYQHAESYRSKSIKVSQAKYSHA